MACMRAKGLDVFVQEEDMPDSDTLLVRSRGNEVRIKLHPADYLSRKDRESLQLSLEKDEPSRILLTADFLFDWEKVPSEQDYRAVVRCLFK